MYLFFKQLHEILIKKNKQTWTRTNQRLYWKSGRGWDTKYNPESSVWITNLHVCRLIRLKNSWFMMKQDFTTLKRLSWVQNGYLCYKVIQMHPTNGNSSLLERFVLANSKGSVEKWNLICSNDDVAWCPIWVNKKFERVTFKLRYKFFQQQTKTHTEKSVKQFLLSVLVFGWPHTLTHTSTLKTPLELSSSQF